MIIYIIYIYIYIYLYILYIYIYIYVYIYIYIYILCLQKENHIERDKLYTSSSLEATVSFDFGRGTVLITLFLMPILTRDIILQCCCRTRNDPALHDAKFQYFHTIKQQSLVNNN